MTDKDRPPDQVTCLYCGAQTFYYQVIAEIQNSKVLSFVIDNLLGSDDRYLKQDSYICMDHVDCFAIKFTQSRRGLEFTRKFKQKQTDKKKVKLSCTVCNGESLGRYHSVDTIKSNSLKRFVMNELSRHGEMITRKGTGIVEADHLCHKCCEAVRKKSHAEPLFTNEETTY